MYTYERVHRLRSCDLIGWEVEKIGSHSVCVPMIVVDVRQIPDIDRDDSGHTHYLQLSDPVTGARTHYSVNRWVMVRVIPEHHPVCSSCGGLWPCRENLIGIHVRNEADKLNRACVVCGKEDGWRIATVKVETPDGVMETRYHTRKGSPCRTAYLKAIEGDDAALTALRQEDVEYSVMLAKSRGRRGRR